MELVYIVFIISILIILGIVYYFSRNTHIVRINKNQIMEFKTSFDLTGLPIITFYQGSIPYHFLLDTGSNVSYVNSKSDLQVRTTGVKDVYMGSNGVDTDCEKVEVVLYRNDVKYEHSMFAADLSTAFTELKNQFGVSVTGILGNDFFTKYRYCLDFKELVAYIRK